MDSIEREVESETDERLEDMDQSITVRQRRTIPFSEIAKVAFLRYPKRTALGLALFIGQAFLYNAFTFDLGTLLGEFFGVSSGSVPYYLALFGVSNFMGPFLLGRLFDTVGRRPMVSLCYLGSAGITVLLGALVAGGGLSKWGFMGLLLAAFFLASAGASSAYLTVSEIFPMETRALAVAFFYAVGTAAGGIAGPLLFGHLIDSGDTGQLAIGFFIGAAAMSLGGVAELLFGVEAAGKSLEDIAEPLSSQEGGGEERAVGDAADGRRRHRLGPSSPGSSRGWPVSDRVVAVSVEREVEAVAAAVADEGSLERRELARRVAAARWGPGRFAAVLREAEAREGPPHGAQYLGAGVRRLTRRVRPPARWGTLLLQCRRSARSPTTGSSPTGGPPRSSPRTGRSTGCACRASTGARASGGCSTPRAEATARCLRRGSTRRRASTSARRSSWRRRSGRRAARSACSTACCVPRTTIAVRSSCARWRGCGGRRSSASRSRRASTTAPCARGSAATMRGSTPRSAATTPS